MRNDKLYFFSANGFTQIRRHFKTRLHIASEKCNIMGETGLQIVLALTSK